MESQNTILSVQNLSLDFRLRTHVLHAVRDVSFELRRGRTFCLVGESGSGKTTLGRLILRTVEPSSGTVTYRDRRAEGAALEEKVASLLALVGLEPGAMERYPHAFSGGQRQRIGIARALALDARVIVADEATSALDVSIRSQILDLLLDIQACLDLSFIFITHDISVVRYFCDRVAVMHRGRIVEIADAEKICFDPQEPYTRSLISAVPSPDPRNKRMLHRQRFSAPAN